MLIAVIIHNQRYYELDFMLKGSTSPRIFFDGSLHGFPRTWEHHPEYFFTVEDLRPEIENHDLIVFDMVISHLDDPIIPLILETSHQRDCTCVVVMQLGAPIRSIIQRCDSTLLPKSLIPRPLLGVGVDFETLRFYDHFDGEFEFAKAVV